MSVFPVLFLLTFTVVSGTLNRTFSSLLFDITKETMDLFPTLRKIARGEYEVRENEEKQNAATTSIKKLGSIFGNMKLTERISGRRSPEGRENKDSVMQRIVDTLEPVLTPLRSLTSHVAGNRTISAIFPTKSKVMIKTRIHN
ncbi:uncharacterized protein TNCT_731841 [Trichonephila clavata]|uniref:Uncharacterized protein n=1 Tax=Trichonephila clavata TaxID=2740835 RepID=A0A8X6LHL3_TRICU|nr:uncharacterized protein TNCT_731841 [Trichonephila clavata]